MWSSNWLLPNKKEEMIKTQLKYLVSFGAAYEQDAVEVWAFNIREAIDIAWKMSSENLRGRAITKVELVQLNVLTREKQ
jgi:hypothetical protein